MVPVSLTYPLLSCLKYLLSSLLSKILYILQVEETLLPQNLYVRHCKHNTFFWGFFSLLTYEITQM